MANIIENTNPYIGPRPFETSHRGRFFGREREIREFYSHVMSSRVVILHAKSGTGKTSLLNAGLMPLLEEEPFEIFPISRVRGLIPDEITLEEVQNPFILNTLISWSDGENDVRDLLNMSIYEYLKQIPIKTDKYGLGIPRLIVFDQFEEFFGFYGESRELRRAFFDDLNQALTHDYPEHGKLLRVIFLIREDYIAEMDPYEVLLMDRVKRYRIEFMHPQAALSAVKKPLDETSRSYAAGVGERLVQELSQREEMTDDGQTKQISVPFIEPVQLQVVCQTLWENLPPEVSVIDYEQLEKFGDVDTALTSFYENAIYEAIEQTGVDEEQLRNWFITSSLITTSGKRGSVFQDPQMSTTGGLSNEAVAILENKHLIRGEARVGGRLYELTHDRLVQPIITSNDIWKSELERSAQSQELEIKESEINRLETQQQGLQTMIAVLGIAVVVASVIGAIFFFLESNKATAAQYEAQTSQYLAENNAATSDALEAQAMGQAGTSEANAATSVANANLAATAQADANNNAATSTVAQGEAANNAVTATYAQGQAEFSAATSDANADLAATAQGEAQTQAAAASTAQQDALDNAGTSQARLAEIELAQTSEASLQLTSTAQAIGITQTAIAQVEAPFEYLNFLIDNIESNSLGVFRFSDITLTSERDDFLETLFLDLDVANFMIDATVITPNDASNIDWDFGFLFRDTGTNEQYRLSISSQQTWVLRLRTEETSTIIDRGTMDSLELGDGASNQIKFIVLDDIGLLEVNGVEVARLDISDKQLAGDIGVAIEFEGDFVRDNIEMAIPEITVWAIGQIDEGSTIENGRADGRLERDATDIWWYAGQAGEVITISVDANWDTRLVVYDGFGQLMRINNDSPDGSFVSIVENLLLPTTGLYRIELDSPSRGGGGSYTLFIEESEVELFDFDEIGEDEGDDLLTAWQSDSVPLPLSFGAIEHNVNNDTYSTALVVEQARNFVLDVTFINPYDSTDEGVNWDYGIVFREDGNERYILLFTALGDWTAFSFAIDRSLDLNNGQVIASGTLSNWNDGEDEGNRIVLAVRDNLGLLYVNEAFITRLDLSDYMITGSIELATGLLSGSEIDGLATEYTDLTLWLDEDAAANVPVDAAAIYDSALEAFLADDDELAIALYSRFLLIADDEDENDIAFAYYVRGIAYYRSSQYGEALEDFTVLIEDYPDFYLGIGDVYGWRAFAGYANGNDLNDVLADHDAAIDEGLTDYFIYADRAMVLFGLGRIDEAYESYQIGIDNEPRLLFMYDVDVVYDDPVGNVENYQLVLERDPNNFAPRMIRAAAYAYGGEYDSAITEYEIALESAPDFAPISAALGDIYYALEEYDTAQDYYEDYIELAGDDARADIVERLEKITG